MYKCGVHLALSSALAIGSIILYSNSRNDDVIKQMDSVQLTSWSKPVIDMDKALLNLDNPVLNKDVLDCSHMIDKWWYPQVKYTDPAINPECPVYFQARPHLSSDGVTYVAGSLKATVIDPVPTACTPGVYPIILHKGTNTNPAGLVTGIELNVSTDSSTGLSVLSISNSGIFGGTWSANGIEWRSCAAQRSNLAKWINGNMSCATEASQMCTCVYTFTDLFADFTRNIPDKLNITAKDVLREGLGICHQWRRRHDDRFATEAPASAAFALFIFAFALLMNNLYNTIIKWNPIILTDMKGHAGIQGAYWFVMLVTLFVAPAVGNASAIKPILLIVLPAMAIGLYFEYGIATQHTYHRPYLLPYTFDMCLSALVYFTMLARGVTQFEHIGVELVKCHVVAMLYTAVVWYYIYLNPEGPVDPDTKKDDSDAKKNAQKILGAPSVQDAFLMIVAVAVALSMDNLIIPYPARECYALHYLLPPAFVLIAFLGVAWLSLLNLTHVVHNSSGDSVKAMAYYQDITAYLVFIVGVIMFGLFLKRHMLLYSSRQADAFPFLEELTGAGATIPGFIRTIDLI